MRSLWLIMVCAMGALNAEWQPPQPDAALEDEEYDEDEWEDDEDVIVMEDNDEEGPHN